LGVLAKVWVIGSVKTKEICMEKIINVIIQKNAIDTNYKNRKFLLDLKKHKSLKSGVEVIYFYSLAKGNINYPKQDGNIIYIGEAGRVKSPTGERYKHISPNLKSANDYTSNYTLSQYYELEIPIRLIIYKVPDNFDRKDLEDAFIRKHMEKYGCKPIAQGATGEKNTPKYINKKITEYENLETYL
jgi:hypothetical protein